MEPDQSAEWASRQAELAARLSVDLHQQITYRGQNRKPHRRRKPNRGFIWLMTSLLVASAYVSSPTVSGFNVDSHSAVIHQGPSGSYFGYSVAQHRDRGVGWLLVGAPKAQTDQSATQKAGAVYRCAPNNSKACQQIPFDPNGSSVIQLGSEQRQSDDKSHQWFGASIQSATENGSIVACAPRYVYYSSNLKRRDPVGTCWVSRGSFNGFLEYSPCRLNDQWGHHHMGSCQAGFSSAISKDGSKVFMGAPGSHVWQGQVFAHNLRTDLANSTSAVNPHSEDDSYLGYSLTIGRFSALGQNSAEPNELAIGIPRGANLAGKVMIVDREMRVLRNISGELMGAYFGYSLATADLNGDGLDDLVVGAPLHYDPSIKQAHFERGRVYVAYQTARHDFNLGTKIYGSKDRARFGTALANCGDLNKDGIQDLAVGAPYDGPEMHGAIYIFMGRKGGLALEPDQVIYAESVRNELGFRAFGFSLSGGLDLDGNQYPDLLIGDYQSDRAVLLRTRPVINVVTSISFQPEHFNLDDKSCLLPSSSTPVSCITVQYCIKYTGINVDNRTAFVFDLKLDTENKGAPRLFFLNNEGKNEDKNSTWLTKDVNQCRSFKAYLSRQIRDKLTPLKLDIDYDLAETADVYDYATSSPKLKPALNKAVPNKLSRVATIQKNCGSDNLCVPDLKLTMNANMMKYMMGSNEKLILDVTVRNNGEDAFESMFYLTMPMTISYVNINKTRSDYPICYGAKPDQTGVNILTCDLGNPQPRNDIVKFSIITEPTKTDSFAARDFTFVGQVNSTNPEQDERHREDNQVLIGILIDVKTDLVLGGKSEPTQIIHNSTKYTLSSTQSSQVSEADLGPEVYHSYQLKNRGPSAINDLAVTILWPTKSKDGKYLLYLVDEPLTSDKVRCKPTAENVINPERLKYLRGNPVRSANQEVAEVAMNDELNTLRMKRQITSPSSISPEQQQHTYSTVDSSILQQLNWHQCGPEQCNRFECNVYNLGQNDVETIRIRSRLVEATISKLSVQEFVISSKLVAQVKSLPYNVSSHTIAPYEHKVETLVHTTGLAVQDLVPWWLILLAILLGITLFILLAWFFKYLGFFARKRPPKGVEREPLTPTMWNDYQYTPGDTAL